MKKSKMLAGIAILVIILFFVMSVAMPVYYNLFYGNVQVKKYATGICTNVNTAELKNYPALEKLIKGEGCPASLNENSYVTCRISPEEWEKAMKYTDNKSTDGNPERCIKFENYDGVYTFNFRRP